MLITLSKDKILANGTDCMKIQFSSQANPQNCFVAKIMGQETNIQLTDGKAEIEISAAEPGTVDVEVNDYFLGQHKVSFEVVLEPKIDPIDKLTKENEDLRSSIDELNSLFMELATLIMGE